MNSSIWFDIMNRRGLIVHKMGTLVKLSKKVPEDCFYHPTNTPISPRIILVPIVLNLYIWLIGGIYGKAIGDLRTITGNHLGRSGKVWRNSLSPMRVGYRKSDRLLFLNKLKNSSPPEPVGPRPSWSPEGPLKVFLSRLPSGALVYPLELSSTLGSFRILSAAQSAVDLA